jgi:hypothetical protein
LQTKRERQSHSDQRDPARHLHAKAFSLPAQEAADEGINISQGSNMAIYIPF